MSNLLFLDSFDHYSTTQGSRKWTTWTSASISAGRTGNGALVSAGAPSGNLGVEYLTLTMGVAYKTDAYSNGIVGFSNVLKNLTVSLRHVGDGRLFVSGGAGLEGGSSASSSFLINLHIWYYAELQITISVGAEYYDGSQFIIPVTYTYEARINEATILSGGFTIAARKNFIAARVGDGLISFGLDGPGGGANAVVDDVYVTDTEFLGDVKIGVLYPNATGDSSTWGSTPLLAGPTLNYQNVDEHPADDDTTVVTAATPGLKDIYNIDNVPSGFIGTIKGVQALWLVKKSDAGSAFVKGVWRDPTTPTEITQTRGYNFVAPNGYPPSYVDYSYSREPERKSLFTTSDWTISEINLLQLGIIRTV